MAVLADSGLIARKIADCERVICAAPSYLDAHGTPRKPEDLMQHECLLLRYPGSQQFRWTLQAKGSPVTLSVRGSCDADDGDVLTDWALDGRGIVMKPLWEVAGHLRDGSLVPLLLDHPPEPAVLTVLYPHRDLVPARLKAFADFAVERLSQVVTAQLDGLDFAALR